MCRCVDACDVHNVGVDVDITRDADQKLQYIQGDVAHH